MNATSISKIENPPHLDGIQKVAIGIGSIGLLIMIVAWLGIQLDNPSVWLYSSMGLITIGVVVFSVREYLTVEPGIKNNGVFFSGIASRGVIGWAAAIFITGFYILLYCFPAHLGLGMNGEANTGIVALFDPLSYYLKGQAASQWFLYGTLYTLAILVFGFKFLLKYRHNKYQTLRTISVMFFQLGFSFLLPEFMQSMNKPYYNFSNMWPLNYYFFDEWHIKGFVESGSIGLFMLAFGLAMVFLISPILTYFYGKRWYCSWVCGCGGLAETAGDPFRHQSDKSMKAWKIERWMVHSILIFALAMTAAVVYSMLKNNPNFAIDNKTLLFILAAINAVFWYVYLKTNLLADLPRKVAMIFGVSMGLIFLLIALAYVTGSNKPFLLIDSYKLRQSYGFLIGSVFSGIIGVGFYPIMGSRVWCRFGCPMAAILGIQQKFFSRFRITTNGGQCISCGNCSTYCEMGIDVRAYAQKGQNIVRASCVGCGICSAVCPRGVLKLEGGNADMFDRTTELKSIMISEDQVRLLD